jgi:hypothetical protein
LTTIGATGNLAIPNCYNTAMAGHTTSKQATIYQSTQARLEAAQNDIQLFEAIVNAPFQDKVTAALLSLGIVVFLRVNPHTKTIDRVALSNTELAKGATSISEKEFHNIKIPLGYTKNAIAKAINTGKPQKISDWQYLFIPAMSPEAARFNQAGAGIGCSVVYPYAARDGGALIFSYYQTPEKIGRTQQSFMKRYTELINEALAS